MILTEVLNRHCRYSIPLQMTSRSSSKLSPGGNHFVEDVL